MTYDKEKLLKIVKKTEQSEIACLERLIGIPTCYARAHLNHRVEIHDCSYQCNSNRTRDKESGAP